MSRRARDACILDAMIRTLAPRFTGAAVAALLFAASPASGAQASADPHADRIAALEARVRQLEALVQRLTAEQPVAPAESREPGDFVLSTPTPETPLPAAPTEGASRLGRADMPQELLPDLGKIGAAATFLAGAHSGPFGLRAGSYFGGSVELPLVRAPGGRVLYEFSAALGRSDTALRVTSNVAQVANLAVLANVVPGGGEANVAAALEGRPPAPFPVRYDVTNRLQLLEVVPFGLKYVNTSLDRVRLRPYVAVGLAAFVTITNQRTTPGSAAAPFGGALIGGQITSAQELVAQGIPSGQGALDIGVQTGGGVEYRVKSGLSIGVDVRVHRTSSGRTYLTTATRSGFHF
jgi:hypothetical protein